MTEENKTAPAAGEEGVAIQVLAQYIKDLSFESPNAPESLLSNWGAPETNVQVNINVRKLQDNTYETILLFRVEARNKEKDKAVFITELAYGCSVLLRGIPEEHHNQALMVEVPKLMFPFCREIIASASIQGGYPPLYMQPMNFEAIYVAEAKKQQAAKEAETKKEA